VSFDLGMTETVISLKNVSKCFKRYRHPVDRLKEMIFPSQQLADEFWELLAEMVREKAPYYKLLWGR
jgi:hypothetical protein